MTLRVLHLARGEVAVGVVLELLGEHQQAVQRRAQLVRHVGDELRLVLGGHRQLGRLLLDEPLRLLDLLVLATRPRCSCRRAGSPARRGPRSTGAAAPGATAAPAPATGPRSSSFSVTVVALTVFSTRPMLSVSWSRKRLVGRAEGGERRQLDDGADGALEQDRQHDDVQRRRLAEAGVDRDVVGTGPRSGGCAPSRARTGRRGPRRAGRSWRGSCAP